MPIFSFSFSLACVFVFNPVKLIRAIGTLTFDSLDRSYIYNPSPDQSICLGFRPHGYGNKEDVMTYTRMNGG